ncbi:DUF4276 family protein [Roseiflexus sp.]|uniref:DUF4276 family protein n=1 Tax=Roseiflexus sp. TaxID=2562120 RepID=UPI00398B83C5
MKKGLILCEGQTEETFVKHIIAPHLLHNGIVAIPTLIVTRQLRSGMASRGGITRYPQVRRDILNLLHDKSAAMVTTLIDYYGLPDDFPGVATLPEGSPYQKVAHLEQAFAQDIGNARFFPYFMLHEFEAFLFVQPEVMTQTLDQRGSLGPLFSNPSSVASPEEINDGPHTHPAARIQRRFRQYRKALHGPLIIEKIGLSAIREKCPHFDAWLRRLEGLAGE